MPSNLIQLDFLDGAETPRSLTHRTDPQTSEAAARDLIQSGRLGEQQEQVLKLVRTYPDSTSAELAKFGRLERHIPARRLSELKRKGLVKVSGQRPCKTNGRLMQTYQVTQ